MARLTINHHTAFNKLKMKFYGVGYVAFTRVENAFDVIAWTSHTTQWL